MFDFLRFEVIGVEDTMEMEIDNDTDEVHAAKMAIGVAKKNLKATKKDVVDTKKDNTKAEKNLVKYKKRVIDH